jgi:hypothetical protein
MIFPYCGPLYVYTVYKSWKKYTRVSFLKLTADETQYTILHYSIATFFARQNFLRLKGNHLIELSNKIRYLTV